MKQHYDEYMEQSECENSWMTISNLMAAGLLVFILIFIIGISYYRDMAVGSTVQPVPVPQEQQAIDNHTPVQDALIEKQAKIQQHVDKLAHIAGIRSRIIDELLQKLGQSSLKVDIDSKTGDVRFGEGLFFDADRESINTEGQRFLKEFIPIYLSVLFSDNNKQYLDQIIIEGHTDDDGTYLYNLELSEKRAASVARYIFNNGLFELPNVSNTEQYFTISGRSYSRSIKDGRKVDKAKSRRVEFKFHLKDEEMIQEMQAIVEGAK